MTIRGSGKIFVAYLAMAAVPVAFVFLAQLCACAVERPHTKSAQFDTVAFDACVGYCLHLYGYHCDQTLQWYWSGECRDDCFDYAYEAELAGCNAQLAGWMECEQTQVFTCENGWPYQWTDYCHAEADAYEACRRDA